MLYTEPMKMMRIDSNVGSGRIWTKGLSSQSPMSIAGRPRSTPGNRTGMSHDF
ncbi:hypothetical protein PM082_000364 [Marasmius tenuissimus]|nr:hypothetical protein PM082_000364 [Marasmius tenuissimus]